MNYTKQLLAMMLLMTPFLAGAQMASNVKIKAQVPFDFVVDGKVVPAGICTVQRASANSDTLIIWNRDQRASLFLGAHPSETRTVASDDALVFHQYGNRYFLSGIRLEGTRSTYQLAESKEEIELKHKAAHAVESVIAALK